MTETPLNRKTQNSQLFFQENKLMGKHTCSSRTALWFPKLSNITLAEENGVAGSPFELPMNKTGVEGGTFGVHGPLKAS
jgi:hypothetical protein